MAEVGGVREYKRIRRFLGYIYLYGFFSREDFARKGIGSVKDYDYGAKLIRSIFPDSEDTALWQAGKKYLRIQREYARSGENRMTDSYLLHTLDERRELPELLVILSTLTKRSCSLDELCRAVELRCMEETSKYSTVRRRVRELLQYGYVSREKNRFALASDGFCGLSDGELEDLYRYVRFAAGITYPRTAGSFLRRTLEREMLRRGQSQPEEAPILLRHSVNFNVLDEELVYQLLDIIRERRRAVLKIGRCSTVVLPVALRIDTRLGRWYLLAMGERPVMCRVSSIQELKADSGVLEEDWKKAEENVLQVFACSGCSGAFPEEGPILVEAELHFHNAPGMRAQFGRELRIGKIVTRDCGEYYQAWVNDPMELLPWLRSYAPWLRVLPGKHDLPARLREDLVQMLGDLDREAHG